MPEINGMLRTVEGHRVGEEIMQRWRNRIHHGLRWFAILIAVAWTLFPFAYAFVLSLKPSALEYRTLVIPFVQFRPTIAHWRWEWWQRHEINGLGDGIRNSVVVGVTTAVMSTSVGLLTAFGLRQMRATTRWAGGFIAFTLLPRIVPAVALVTPIYFLSVQTHLHDTLIALMLLHGSLALPLAVVVLDSALREFPKDLIEAAKIDGATNLRVLWQIVTPLMRPMLIAVSTLSFALSWNDYIFAQTNHVQRAFTMPLSVSFLEERDGVQFEHVGSHLVLILLVPLLLGLVAQRSVVRGLSLGAVRSDR